MSFQQKLGLVIGGGNTLGKSIINNFQPVWKMTSLDFVENTESQNNIIIQKNQTLQSQLEQIKNQINQQNQKYNAIIYVNSGEHLYKDNGKDANLITNYQQSYKNIVEQALLAVHISTQYLDEEGLLVLHGCQKTQKLPRNEHITYSLAQNAIVSLTQNFQSLETSKNKSVIALLTENVDTIENREVQPKENFEKWISCDSIAGLLNMWSNNLNRPKTGSLAEIKCNDQKLANPTFL